MKLVKNIFTSVQMSIRSQQIALILSRHGVASYLSALGIEVSKRSLTFVGIQSKNTQKLDALFGKKLASTLIHLGPTFIKLGQVLATRDDIIGKEISLELKNLFDQIPPISFSQISRILEKEIGKEKIKKLFSYIDKKALAAASIGQVHLGELKNGNRVIIKIQRPRVKKLVRIDLKLIHVWVKTLDIIYPKYQLLQLYQDFKESTLKELDYKNEIKNMERFFKNHKKFFGAPDIIIPHVYKELSSSRVLVMDFIKGRPLRSLTPNSLEAQIAAEKALTSILEQIFVHGFFHADPHGGNIFFYPDQGKIGIIDYGLMGQLERGDRRKFMKLLQAIITKNRAKIAKTLYQLGTPSPHTNFDNFNKDIFSLLDEIQKNGGRKSIKFEVLTQQLLSLSHLHEIYIPNRYLLMMRSWIIIDGLVKGLHSNIVPVEVALRVVGSALIKTLRPWDIFSS